MRYGGKSAQISFYLQVYYSPLKVPMSRWLQLFIHMDFQKSFRKISYQRHVKLSWSKPEDLSGINIVLKNRKQMVGVNVLFSQIYFTFNEILAIHLERVVLELGRMLRRMATLICKMEQLPRKKSMQSWALQLGKQTVGGKGGRCDRFYNTMSSTEKVMKEWLFIISHSMKATEYSVKLFGIRFNSKEKQVLLP